jgi:hypothetical protein
MTAATMAVQRPNEWVPAGLYPFTRHVRASNSWGQNVWNRKGFCVPAHADADTGRGDRVTDGPRYPGGSMICSWPGVTPAMKSRPVVESTPMV